MLLRYALSRLRSTQVAVVHCSAQTSSRHVLQKLGQTCMLLSSNTGRVFRPKDCENLVLYLKDINLPKPDKWGTSNLTAFLQQVDGGQAESISSSLFLLPQDPHNTSRDDINMAIYLLNNSGVLILTL